MTQEPSEIQTKTQPQPVWLVDTYKSTVARYNSGTGFSELHDTWY